MGGVKKSIYIFLCSMLGVMLFLILHRLVMFSFVVFAIYAGYSRTLFGSAYLSFLAFDYVTLVLAMLAGSWYGIWLGTYWYEQVYELGNWRGAIYHLRGKMLPVREDARLQERIQEVQEILREDIREAEELSAELQSSEPELGMPVLTPEIQPIVIRPKTVRRRPASASTARRAPAKKPASRSRVRAKTVV